MAEASPTPLASQPITPVDATQRLWEIALADVAGGPGGLSITIEIVG